MSEATELPQTGVLCAECEAELKCWDMYSELHDELAWIRDEEGTFLFSVTGSIKPHDLRNLLRYGREQFRRGGEHGRSQLAASLRILIGAQSAG